MKKPQVVDRKRVTTTSLQPPCSHDSFYPRRLRFPVPAGLPRTDPQPPAEGGRLLDLARPATLSHPTYLPRPRLSRRLVLLCRCQTPLHRRLALPPPRRLALRLCHLPGPGPPRLGTHPLALPARPPPPCRPRPRPDRLLRRSPTARDRRHHLHRRRHSD